AKVTEPVATAVLGELTPTVAVKVTGVLKGVGFADELSMVLVPAAFTCRLPVEEPLRLESVVLAYVALEGGPPRPSDEVEYVALPVPSSVSVTFEPSSVNVTLPVGTPPPGDLAATWTVKPTFCPNTAWPDEGLTLTLVAVSAGLTTWLRAGPV